MKHIPLVDQSFVNVSSTKKHLIFVAKNQRGQMAIEMVLMTAVMVAATLFIASEFKKNEFVANLVSGPWQTLSGMIQNGVWGTPQDTMAKHPNHSGRVNTVKGEDLR